MALVCKRPLFPLVILNLAILLNVSAKFKYKLLESDDCILERIKQVTSASDLLIPETLNPPMDLFTGRSPVYRPFTISLLGTKHKTQSLAHIIAESGLWEAVPISFLSKDLVRAKDSNGDTVIHRAACFGKIHEIPKSLISDELFLVQNDSGETALHLAAKGVDRSSEFIFQIPEQLLTEKNLLMQDKDGNTPLHHIFSSNFGKDLSSLLAALPKLITNEKICFYKLIMEILRCTMLLSAVI